MDNTLKRYAISLGLLVLCMGMPLLDSRTAGAEQDARYKIMMSKDKRLCTHINDAEWGPD
jgi:hypothetical protein